MKPTRPAEGNRLLFRLALLVLFPLAGSSRFLLDLEPAWIFWLAGFLSVLFAGAVCIYCGTRWNRFGIEHSFYFVPLQTWGWMYLSVVALIALGAVAGSIRQGLDKARWLYQGIAGLTALLVVIATGVNLRRLAHAPLKALKPGTVDDTDPDSLLTDQWDGHDI